jgi:integrase
MARKTISDATIAALKPRDKRYTVSDPKFTGLVIRVTPNGVKTFYAISRDPLGRQVWHAIGPTHIYSLEQARTLARDAIQAIRAGKPAGAAKSFQAVSDEWLLRHVDKKGLRSGNQIKSYLKLHILPAWGPRPFESIRRNDVAKLLDHMEDNSGTAAADEVLKIAGGIFRWYATRHEDYASPVIHGMRRYSQKENARERILNDDELRAVWKQAEVNGSFGAFIRLLLLTGQRREKVRKLRWDDLTTDGRWVIRTEPREKPNAGELVLPQVACDIINAQPQLAGNPYVFSGRGDSPMRGFAWRKAGFSAKLPDMPLWTLHDLRRTARSLMTRAGVSDSHAERVLGHVQPGVQGVYNRHEYREEKAHALRALAGLIDNIVNPPADNVVSLVR